MARLGTTHLEAASWKAGADLRSGFGPDLGGFQIEHPLPPLWNEFEALARVPVLVVRGGRSDILSAATLTAMRARQPDLESIEVPDQGHVPLLEGDDLIRRITAFVEKCERTARPRKT